MRASLKELIKVRNKMANLKPVFRNLFFIFKGMGARGGGVEGEGWRREEKTLPAHLSEQLDLCHVLKVQDCVTNSQLPFDKSLDSEVNKKLSPTITSLEENISYLPYKFDLIYSLITSFSIEKKKNSYAWVLLSYENKFNFLK